MKTYSLYDPSTGLFNGTVLTMSDEMLAAHVREGLAAVEGSFDSRLQRVDPQTLDILGREAPDMTGERARLARYRRERLLSLCDWVVTRAAERGEPIEPGWGEYRQA